MRTHLILQIVFLTFFYPVFSQNTTDSFTDSRDGKVYKTVKIGDQWWMAENLAWLPSVSLPAARSYIDPNYYVFTYSGTDVLAAKATEFYSRAGVLYNWPAALTACPVGWHLPSDNEWKKLEISLGMTQAQADSIVMRGFNQGSQMKATKWWAGEDATNSSGFSAHPGGCQCNSLGAGFNAFWWSSSELSTENAWARILVVGDARIGRADDYKEIGFSVRCIRDSN